MTVFLPESEQSSYAWEFTDSRDHLQICLKTKNISFASMSKSMFESNGFALFEMGSNIEFINDDRFLIHNLKGSLKNQFL